MPQALHKLGAMVHTCNHGTWEVETGGSERSSRSSLATHGVQGQPGIKNLVSNAEPDLYSKEMTNYEVL